jgi:hypothetical protein
MLDQTRRFSFAFIVLASSFALMGEDCGPAVGLHPAYKPNAVVTDDTIAGAFVVVSSSEAGKKPPKATITRDDTADGPSYLLVVNDSTDASVKDVRFRLFVVDVPLSAAGNGRIADVVVERIPSAKVKKTMADEWTLPVHLYMRLTRTAGDGVMLEFLEQKWIDGERSKDKTITVVELPRDYRKNDDKTLAVSRSPALSVDTAAMQKLLTRALAADAWSDGLELARPGTPTFDFTLTLGDRTIDVQGTRVEVTQGGKKTKSLLKDPKRIEELVRALEKTPRTKTAAAAPSGAAATTCMTLGTAKARCVGETGADRDALVALRDALTTNATSATPAP